MGNEGPGVLSSSGTGGGEGGTQLLRDLWNGSIRHRDHVEIRRCGDQWSQVGDCTATEPVLGSSLPGKGFGREAQQLGALMAQSESKACPQAPGADDNEA